MKFNKKILTLILILSIIGGITLTKGISDESKYAAKADSAMKDELNSEEEESFLSFDELLGDEIDKFDEKQVEKLKDLYSKILVYEKNKNYRKADLLWEEFDGILEDVGINAEEFYDSESDKNKITSYKVTNGEVNFKFNKEVSKEDMNKYKLMWDKSKKIIPKSYINRITEFEIMTDGKDEMLAYVHSPDNKNKKWTLAIDLEDAFNKKGKLIGKDLDETIVHEFAHILTLNDNQVIPKEIKSVNYITDEGTTKKDSYLNLFYKKFWADIFEEFKTYSEDEENEEALIEFYDKYKSRFVSEYAATNPEEDIAESFKEFVVSEKPKGNSIAKKKILFFYDFPELVKIREEIRKSL
ncbi:hypothetical protein [Tepidibacter hydrothermalis]|uniref:Uncharacterized protein n=1 Tax=Tepidibacter hydrothermalis TaxID=3036126 RepID=A0ABY8EJG4_9FIRM|nr:hypothetical protein [Tepidibacter hydrothermalis]WFD11190.1 hypothetical protein P4S50_03680 [Tepidibacter hydrothermalis]